MRIALIDGDFIAWKITPNKKQTPEQIAEYGNQTLRTFDDICREIDEYFIQKVLIPTRADYYLGFLGTDTNFRKSICEDYKALRSIERPKYFREANLYLRDKWGFHFVEDMEAEDAVGICIDLLPKDLEYVIVGQDHDLDQLPGLHFNPVREEWNDISVGDAAYKFATQCLTGCSTDKVRGLPGKGLVAATKILEGVPIEHNEPSISTALLNRVFEAYVEYYGLYDGVYYFQMNFRLLRILRKSSNFVLPNLNSTVIGN